MSGLTYAEIAKALNVSRQRAAYMILAPKSVRDMMRAKADGKCERCGIEIRNGAVHHKNSTGTMQDDYNDVKNLQYLCHGCHSSVHHLKRIRQREYCVSCGHAVPRQRVKYCSDKCAAKGGAQTYRHKVRRAVKALEPEAPVWNRMKPAQRAELLAPSDLPMGTLPLRGMSFHTLVHLRWVNLPTPVRSKVRKALRKMEFSDD